MADVQVSISESGAFSPAHIQLQTGDEVTFAADGADTVLCISEASVFGEARYEISSGDTLALQVQAGAAGPFDMMAVTGDLAAPCDGGRGGTEEGGGGEVGFLS